MLKRILAGLGFILVIVLIWLATTDHSRVWPYRNYVYYQVQSRWWGVAGEPQSGPAGRLAGTVRDDQGTPIAGAWVVLARWNSTAYTARTDAEGHYTLAEIPAGRYRPLAGSVGYSVEPLGQRKSGVQIEAGQTITADAVLAPAQPRRATSGQDFKLGPPGRIDCTNPLEASTTQQAISFISAGRPNQPAFFYRPLGAAPENGYPLLLIIYPGPAESWQCASAPLAASGYAVVAMGPNYTLEMDPDVDELERLLDFAVAGKFPDTDATHTAILGGSYSGIHTQLMLRRERPEIKAAVLLGAPTDIFAMRKHLEEGTFFPPFGLDKVLVALGLPDRQPELYWHYSGAYRVQSNLPPILIIHSRSDEVVPVDQSDLLVAGLVEAGVPHQIHYFDEASHYLLSPSGESLEIYELTRSFLAEHLKP